MPNSRGKVKQVKTRIYYFVSGIPLPLKSFAKNVTYNLFMLKETC